MQYSTISGKRFTTSKAKLDKLERKEVRSIRLSDIEMEKIEAGKLRLTVVNGRITTAV